MVGGVLSVDVAGPMIPAYDMGGKQARWLLVGVLTWRVPRGTTRMKPEEDQPVPEGAPAIEAGGQQEGEDLLADEGDVVNQEEVRLEDREEEGNDQGDEVPEEEEPKEEEKGLEDTEPEVLQDVPTNDHKDVKRSYVYSDGIRFYDFELMDTTWEEFIQTEVMSSQESL